MPLSTVTQLVGGKPLAALPNDPALFPLGWPNGTHPVLLSFSYLTDIKQDLLFIPLRISSLMAATIEIPCVDQLGDRITCFTHTVTNLIGGGASQFDSSIIPSIVATLEGNTVIPGTFEPSDAAYNVINDEYQAHVLRTIVPNPLSGPGVEESVFSMQFNRADSGTLLTDRGFKFLISQPSISNIGLTCQRRPRYFNETYSDPFFCNGNATIEGSFPPSLAGIRRAYANQPCWSAAGSQVAYFQQNCRDAAQQNDPASWA
ncbi:hypothetical protein F4778DRAFT_779440 [Xylariomycetidae sp. FL2044]|nr:hypothetical protein F4778DRAFT_779440 [Xylariomycetidae sp. FL2044]